MKHGTLVKRQGYAEHSAAWLDRQWFDARPHRRLTIRAATANEIKDMGGCTHVIVRKLSTDTRLRHPMWLACVAGELIEKLHDDRPVAPALEELLDCMAHRRPHPALNFWTAL